MDCEASTSHDVLERILLDESAKPTQLSLSLLEDITNRFSLDREIGKGGFAVVYKGMVGRGMVAVKKLSSTIDENIFQEEVKNLMKAKHKNIVRFLGYCIDMQGLFQEYEGNLVMAEQRKWLLCFEYVCNGSLDKHITDASCGLNWTERNGIIRGICEGLLFLHEKRILHLDLKPANILLDGHKVPKIADFGLSKCLGEEQTHASIKHTQGTMGYMDPEYLRSRRSTFMTDIYSLGVVIMEILTGVKHYLEEENVVESWMSRLEASEGDMQVEQVRLWTKIGIECMNLDPKKRPAARDIIERLDKTTRDDYLDKTGTGSSLVELEVGLPTEQLGEGIGELADESFQEAGIKELSKILEDFAGRLEWLHLHEGKHTVGQLSLQGVQDGKEKFNNSGTSTSSSISYGDLNCLETFNRKARKNRDRKNRDTLENSYFVNIFSKEELMPILRGSNLIGKGVGTEVYKGVVDNALVALKKVVDGNVLTKKQLETEVIIQSNIIHKNIVWLLGCCLEMDSLILVYEYLPRGSLHEIIHSSSKVPLSLDMRLSIVAGSAHGLAYLHSQAHCKILHGNFNPGNILLDDNFMPKISDFGILRLVAGDKEHTVTFIGDKTYMDPLYMQTGILTEKSDVYSFGIVILEVISRKKATYYDENSLVKSFLEVNEKGKKSTELFDKEIAVTTEDLEILDCLAEIAVECLNLDMDQRPSMTDIAERLLILNRFRRSHTQHIETDISNLLAQQQKAGQLSLLGVQDMNRRGTSISSSISSGFNKLNNLDILNKKARMNIESNGRHALQKSSFMKIFRMKQVKAMLKDSNFIGQGAFSAFYKGHIDGQFVAVKKPIRAHLEETKQFENEVIIQSQVVHKNIHRLIGCCPEWDIPVLVYEFCSGGSLDDILHGVRKVHLNLDVRLRIVAESAQGLAYLHSQAHCRILHGDVRPRNILFDDNFIAKISDFSLSRLIARDNEHTVTVIGEMAYMDPIYLQTGLLTEKSDVYSFGIVILEVICRKKDTHCDSNNLVKSFLEVHEDGKKATELFDKEIAVTGNLEILDCLAELAVHCLNLDVDKRPTMTYVVERLVTLQRYHSSQVVRQ